MSANAIETSANAIGTLSDAESTSFDISATQAKKRRTVGFSAFVSPARLLIMDKFQRYYQRKREAFSFGAQVDFACVARTDKPYYDDYFSPLFSAGIRYNANNITMHRPDNGAWGMAHIADYESRMGDNVTLYGTFTRAFLRTKYFAGEASLGAGMTYSATKYDKHTNVDNELLGSRFLIYFTAGLRGVVRVADDWGVYAGYDFFHHSNGALNRPNKGANFAGPVVGVRYMPYYDDARRRVPVSERKPFAKHWMANIAAGVGAKTLLEDWQTTQFETPPESLRYRTGNFKLYATYSLQANAMYRYARRWASGAGADVFYTTYSGRINEIDMAAGETGKTAKPWSVGLSAKHQAYFSNLSVAVALGTYLYRKEGVSAREVERPIYENVGLRYAVPALGGTELGFNIKAHKLKADYTELVISYPFKF